MKELFDHPLFIFEMANNHMGSVEHGLNMINAFAEIAKPFRYRFAFKFQFRDFDTFIHPDYQPRMDLKYVKRFSETRLSREQFQRLKDAVAEKGFLAVCTPFDEASVGLVEEMGFALLKIASCSFSDWPLLERVATTDLPIIASTAGATLDDMDKVVSFFQHRRKRFALMHCVGEYPTPLDHLQLNQIDLLRHRYPDVPIGYSTHEEPDNTESIQIAIAKGAALFEKHVAVATERFPKNAYSATPEQVQRWLQAADRAYAMGGPADRRCPTTEKELADLRQFQRGVFAARKIEPGERLGPDNTFLAFPNGPRQLLANDRSKYVEHYAENPIEPRAPVTRNDVASIDTRERVYVIVQQVRKMLAEANVVVPGMATLEISHHYGLDRFEDVGSTIINVINRGYCKKYIIVFPGQTHPEQHHKVKEETFVVLHGDLRLSLNGIEKPCRRGDIVTVKPGTRHQFTSDQGAIIEEISSTHFPDDSYYADASILRNKDRKTVLSYWMD